MKNEIELRLHGNLLSDWCMQKAAQSSDFLYQRGFDSTHKTIRFSTKTLERLFSPQTMQRGYWRNGRAMMYEIRNATDRIELSCIASPVDLNRRDRKRMEQLVDACGITLQDGRFLLIRWDLSEGTENINQVIAELEQVFNFELCFF